jgi:flavodoxin I
MKSSGPIIHAAPSPPKILLQSVSVQKNRNLKHYDQNKDRDKKEKLKKMVKLLVLYDSQTGNTGKMAEAVAEGARSVPGIEVELKYFARSEELAEADAVIFGSPTYYHEITLPIKQMLEEAARTKVKLQGKIGAAFGSYGWSGEAPEQILEILKNRFGMETIEPAISILYEPKQTQLEECRKLGKTVAEKVVGK